MGAAFGFVAPSEPTQWPSPDVSLPLRCRAKRNLATRNHRVHIHGVRSTPATVTARVVRCPAITRVGSSAGQQCLVSAETASRAHTIMRNPHSCGTVHW